MSKFYRPGRRRPRGFFEGADGRGGIRYATEKPGSSFVLPGAPQLGAHA
jgi:hypothetical protein